MTLQNSLAGSSLWIPNPHTRIQAASCNSLTVKSNSINLAEVSVQCAQATSVRDAPNLRRRIIATRNYDVTVDLKTPNAGQMAYKHILAEPCLDVPDSQGGVSRTRNGSVCIRHLQASDSRSMTAQRMSALAVIMLVLSLAHSIIHSTYPVAISQTLTSRSQPPLTSVSPQGTIAHTPMTWP